MPVIRVAPVRRLPLNRALFDYLPPEHNTNPLLVGQLCYIPFGKRTEFGVIIEIVDKPEVDVQKLKKIQAVVFQQPAVSLPLVKFLLQIATTYATPLGFLLKSTLLPLQKRKIQKLAKEREGEKIISDPKNNNDRQPQLFVYQHTSEKILALERIIATHPTGQILITTPNNTFLQALVRALPTLIQDHVLVINGSATPKQQFSDWVSVWSGKKRIIIGTRAAIFLPWQNLVAIIMDQEGHPDYKNGDMAPRYETRDLLLQLAHQFLCQLHFVTSAPTVETCYLAAKKIYLSAATSYLPAKFGPHTIINLENERKRGNYGGLSSDVQRAIKETIERERDVFLFVHRRGSAAYLVCRDCSLIFRCPACKAVLATHHGRETELMCHACNEHILYPTTCPDCGGASLHERGIGTESIEHEVRSLLENSPTPIERIDSNQPDNNKTRTPEPRIIIGTTQAWQAVSWERVGLFVFIDTDTPLSLPDYQSNERLFQQIFMARAELPKNAEVIFQTNNPEHVVFRGLADPNTFYVSELKTRKMLRYPPFYHLIRLSYGATTAPLVSTETRRFYQQLLNIFGKNQHIALSPPTPETPKIKDRRYWQSLILKIKYGEMDEVLKIVSPAIPMGWKIDISPLSLL